MADEHMVEFEFAQPLSHPGLVHEVEGPPERAGDAHLLFQPAGGRLCDELAGPGMTAAGIAPQAAAVVFAQGPLLEQQLAGRIEQED